ncbi:MAG: hypothetical protein D6698_14880 [Gammaproteobacteria bacterium]|nr:MAG: hypothetical protein D6698_14880 [Gammaproteobacteria bacterium]
MNSSDSRHPEDAWLERLTGVDSPAADDPMLAVLRQVILKVYEEQVEHGEDLEGLERLLARCRAEGFIEEREQPLPWWRRYWMSGVVVAATACALVLVGVNLGLLGSHSQLPDKTYRAGKFAGGQTIRVGNPMAAAMELERALKGTGVNDVTAYQSDERWYVSARVGVPANQRVGDVLKLRGISLPENGVLRVQFVPE